MGHVESIWIGAESGGALRRVDSVRAEAGRGLVGDRYFLDAGTSSPGSGRDLTLVAAEAIEAAEAALGRALPPDATRRNVVTRGVDLDALLGRELVIGGVRARGVQRCDPCDHLARLNGDPAVLRAFVDRGGLRCDVLEGGEIRAGDPVRPADDATAEAPDRRA